MEAWQFRVFLVESREAAPVLEEGGWRVTPLAEPLIGKALVTLNATLGRPIIITDDWLVFGVDVGNRVNVSVHSTGQGDISAQLDVRVDASPFAAFLCSLAEEVDCLFFCVESNEVIQPTRSDLLTAIEQSPSAAFCEGPKRFLRKLLQSC